MARRPDFASLDLVAISQLLEVGENTPNLEERMALIRAYRSANPEASNALDRFLLENNDRLRAGLLEAKANQQKLKEILDRLAATPWFPATWLSCLSTSQGDRAIVFQGRGVRMAALADGLTPDQFETGTEIFLSNDLNTVMEKSPGVLPQGGKTAPFDRYTPDGRLVLKWRDEEFIVESTASLKRQMLEQGDLIRWDQEMNLGFERIDRAANKKFTLDEIPNIDVRQVGGQARALETLLAALTTTLIAPEKAKAYGLGGRQSVLMVGPPGCGKTLMARIAVSEISRLSGRKCHFAVVKPAEWEDPYVGATQGNIRNCFAMLRESAKKGFAVLFLDEIEAVGRIRGSAVGHHSDKFLAAFLAELDGFTDRAGVAILAATNFKAAIDPALLERLSDVEIFVPRPDRNAARDIFSIHLSEGMPYNPNGELAAATRRQIVDAAVSRFYAPNANNELNVVKFRDGKARVVTARELASGRLFEQVCRAARKTAFLRDVRGGEPGLQVADMEHAADEAIDRLATTLSPRNIRSYLTDLPQDIDVVSVEPIARRVARPRRYLNPNHSE